MFINNDTADERVNDENNLVNLVLSISNRRPATPRPEPINITPVSEIGLEGGVEDKIDNPTSPDSNDNPPVVAIVKQHHTGRGIGGVEESMEMRHAAALLAQTDSIKDVANALGIDRNTVEQAKHGRSTFGKRNPELEAKLNESLGRVRDLAMDRLLSSLNLLDDEKLKKVSAKDLSTISGNMSKVMASTLPQDKDNRVNAQLIVYAPTFSPLQRPTYDVVEVENVQSK